MRISVDQVQEKNLMFVTDNQDIRKQHTELLIKSLVQGKARNILTCLTTNKFIKAHLIIFHKKKRSLKKIWVKKSIPTQNGHFPK